MQPLVDHSILTSHEAQNRIHRDQRLVFPNAVEVQFYRHHLSFYTCVYNFSSRTVSFGRLCHKTPQQFASNEN